ncbi:MAG: Hpt domain-containing protein [Pseudomonadota bacterium]
MIHWPRVRELRDEVGSEDFAEVVDLFLEEVEEVINLLKSDSGRNNLEQDLHFLKGGALSLGFQHFSDLCQSGEQLSASGNDSDIDLGEIIQAFEQSKSVFQAELAAHV